MKLSIKKNQIIEKLQTCFDPEIPIDLWNLGLIYDINILENNNIFDIEILMTLTTPGCSMINVIAEDVKNKVSKIKGINKTTVNITFDPPWTPEMMTDVAREKLGFNVSKNKDTQKTDWE